MLDARLRPLIDPPLNAAGRVLAGLGVTANGLTFTGLALGLAGAASIALGHIGWGLALIIANRLLDGLDGAVARVRGPSDLGGYFDIVADFAFYVSVPLGFGEKRVTITSGRNRRITRTVSPTTCARSQRCMASFTLLE